MEGGKRVAVGKREEGRKERNAGGQKGHGRIFFGFSMSFSATLSPSHVRTRRLVPQKPRKLSGARKVFPLPFLI